MAIYRNKKLLQASKGRSCVRCGADDGTIVRAHYTGRRQHNYGKGMGCKGSDLVAADLCFRCHKDFDEHWDLGEDGENGKIRQSEDFLHCIMLTLLRDLEEGILK